MMKVSKKVVAIVGTSFALMGGFISSAHANMVTTESVVVAPAEYNSGWALFDTIFTNPMRSLIHMIEGNTQNNTPSAPVVTNIT